MKLHELLRDTGLVADAIDTDREITAITCDSRRIEKDCLFVCIPGTKVDGHRFAAAAERDGAAAIVVQRDLGLRTQLMTDNTRRAWAQICANWFGRPAERLHLIGVTGTNGKTTTTTLIKSMLGYAGHKVGLIGTVCNMVGDRVLPAERTTPDSYDLQSMLALMVVEGCDYCVMEISSHALDQERVAGRDLHRPQKRAKRPRFTAAAALFLAHAGSKTDERCAVGRYPLHQPKLVFPPSLAVPRGMNLYRQRFRGIDRFDQQRKGSVAAAEPTPQFI